MLTYKLPYPNRAENSTANNIGRFENGTLRSYTGDHVTGQAGNFLGKFS